MINNELQKALDELKGIKSGDNDKTIDDTITKPEPKVEFDESERVDARAVISISRNNMIARLMLKAPEKGGSPININIIEKALNEHKVVAGVNKEYINRLVSFSVYDKSFIIAEGHAPVNGEDEYVEFLIDLEDHLTPTIMENGATDYKNLGYHKSVQPNEKLGIIRPPTLGQNGFDVLGNEILADEGKKLTKSPAGANTILDTDNMTILATISGNVYFKKNIFEVRHEKIVKNVDSSTGNINFEGDVKVLNDVFEGFEVRCKGHIKVAGVVENALLISGCDVIVAKGIHGEHCKVYAEGGIRSVHIENASLHCKGSIYADYVLNANIISDDEIHLEGEHGYIIGGSAVATHKIEVDVLGNDTNMHTCVEILKSHFVDPEIAELNHTISSYTAEIDKLTRAWQNISKMEMSKEESQQYVEKIIHLKKEYGAKLEAAVIEHDKLEVEKANEEKESLIHVKKKLHPNVSIKINGVETKTQKIKTKCDIVTKKGRIEFVN